MSAFSHQGISDQWQNAFGEPLSVRNAKPLSGGSINRAFRLDTSRGVLFVKYNDSHAYPGMFEAEKQGLDTLAATHSLRIPEVILCGSDGSRSFLVLEFLETGPRDPGFWENFGQGLAALHRNTHTRFGLDHNNYIGSLPQSNTRQKTWPEFFINERLLPQVEMARHTGLLDNRTTTAFENLYGSVAKIFPPEPPSLLHGDLWSGNFLTGPRGEPCLIDPAVYYGHREMDIAMTCLFGGFAATFYPAYNEVYPMEAGWEERMEVCNLYPLLVHVNLFGGGYVSQVKSILTRFA